MNKRICIILSVLLASVFCFTQIAPGFLHHHCSEKQISLSGTHDHSNVSVHKDSSRVDAGFSSQCFMCASQGAAHHLYLDDIAISVLPAKNSETDFIYRTSPRTVFLEFGTSRAPPVGLA